MSYGIIVDKKMLPALAAVAIVIVSFSVMEELTKLVY